MLLLALLYATAMWSTTEGFDNKKGKTVIYSDPNEYYDEFYASFYDALFHTSDKLS